MASPYLPSFSELNQGGQAALGTVDPGVRYGQNQGIDLLFRAATQQANMRWLKKQEIDRRKEEVFKTLKDLSQIQYMPEDRDVIRQKFAEAVSAITPNAFNGTDDAAYMNLQKKTLDFSNTVNQSKQDKLNYDIDKKVIAENPEFQNNPNTRYIDAFPKMKLGERTYNRLIPTPAFDPSIIGQAAAVGKLKGIADNERTIGDYVMENGQQVFKANPNGKWIQDVSGGTIVDDEGYDRDWDMLVSYPAANRTIKAALDFTFQEELTPEQRKAVTLPDGTPDYVKMMKPWKEMYRPKATARTIKYDDNPFALQQLKGQQAMARLREKVAASKANSKEQDNLLGEIYRRDFTQLPQVAQISGNIFQSQFNASQSLPVLTIKDGAVKTLKPIGAKPVYADSDYVMAGGQRVRMADAKPIGYEGGVYKVRYTDPSGRSISDADMKRGYEERWSKRNPGKSIDDMVKEMVGRDEINYIIEGEDGSVDRQLWYDAQRFMSNRGSKKGQTEVFTETVEE